MSANQLPQPLVCESSVRGSHNCRTDAGASTRFNKAQNISSMVACQATMLPQELAFAQLLGARPQKSLKNITHFQVLVPLLSSMAALGHSLARSLCLKTVVSSTTKFANDFKMFQEHVSTQTG